MPFNFHFLTVMHVRVLSGPRQEVTANDDILSQVSSYDPDDVYSVQIVNIFKGKENVTQLPGLQLVGVRSPIFVIDFHTPAQWWEFCIPSLKAMKRGHEYLLSGYIEKDKLRSSYCNMRHSWASVTHQQRRGLNGKYSENC